MTARIEAAGPLPRVGAVRVAGADRDRAHAHVRVVDVPAFRWGILRSATDESGQARGARRSNLAHPGRGASCKSAAVHERAVSISGGRFGARPDRYWLSDQAG